MNIDIILYVVLVALLIKRRRPTAEDRYLLAMEQWIEDGHPPGKMPVREELPWGCAGHARGRDRHRQKR